MSMLSAQCDELRAMAESIGLAMPQAATLMMETADIISRMDERHAKTLEVGKRWMAKAARFESENAKLRELVRDMMRYYFMPSAIDNKQRETELLERAHELGVEKDNGELCVEVDK